MEHVASALVPFEFRGNDGAADDDDDRYTGPFAPRSTKHGANSSPQRWQNYNDYDGAGDANAPPEPMRPLSLYPGLAEAEREDAQQNPGADESFCFACQFLPRGQCDNRDFAHLQSLFDEWGDRSPLVVLRCVQQWYRRRWQEECNQHWLLSSIRLHIVSHRAMPPEVFRKNAMRTNQALLYHLVTQGLLRENDDGTVREIDENSFRKYQSLVLASVKLQAGAQSKMPEPS
eukprot:g66667.t1